MSPNFPVSSTREEFEKFNAESKFVGVYTEIIIDAPPDEVRSQFLDFESRVNWDPFHRKIEVSNGSLEGYCDDLELTFTLDMKMDGNASKFFMPLSVNANDHESFIWGLSLAPCGFWMFRADHANLFLPSDETGNATRFVQYERQADIVSKLAFDKDTILNAFTAVNEGLKKACEEDS